MARDLRRDRRGAAAAGAAPLEGGGERLTPTRKAVVLARGLGTRMRRADAAATLDDAQHSAADAGVKGMIPIGGRVADRGRSSGRRAVRRAVEAGRPRPFLDYSMSALADAGITDICLVIGPEHQQVRDYYGSEVKLSRLRVNFAVQHEPRGTADAVAAAESFADGELVVVVNSDNYYPVHTLRALVEIGTAGLAAFERDALVRHGNIDPERVAKFSVVEIDGAGMLERIIEKPDAATLAALGPEVYVGMNSWSLPPEIYRACRSIAPSPRGELELPDAVQYARDELGVPFRVLRFAAGVLDLSSRGDIAAVENRLRDIEPRL